MKQRNVSVLLAGIFCFVLASCTGDFLDLNTNKHAASEAELAYDNMTVGGLITQMQLQVFPCVAKSGNVDVNNYQMMYNLAGDIYSGHQGPSNAFENNSNTTYSLKDGWIGTAFQVAYQNSMAPWYTLAQKQEANPTAFAVGQILRVLMMHRITDMYGPLPYEGFVPSTKIPYTGQDQIYYSFFEDLDEAVLTIQNFQEGNPGAKPLAKFDKIYGGDFEKWIKFANSLKLRLAMRIVYADEEMAKRFALEVINSENYFTSNDDNAMLKVDGANTLNPLSMISEAYDDTRLGATMESYLKGYKDPRLALWFRESEFDQTKMPGVKGYYGIRLGSFFSGRDYKDFSKLNITPSTPIQIMTAAEVYFLRAEVAMRWSVGGSDKDLYNEGIKTALSHSMSGGAVSGASLNNYINSTDKPLNYEDPKNRSNSISARSKITVKWNESAGIEEKLERIITQKWIALYPDGQEAWSEFRRTGYPRVIPIRNNTSGNVISSSQQIRRLRFPVEEYTSNPEGVAIGVEKLNGVDQGGTRLWWDKKP